jgi:prepilin-type N-terminal cleavage/methylation domain-containing protein
MVKVKGFTLIELIIFIVISSLLASTLLIAFNTVAIKTPLNNLQYQALIIARTCLDNMVAQKQLNGYSTFTCPSTTVPFYCLTQSGFNIDVNIACTSFNSDANYMTLTVNVTGASSVSLTTLIASY